MNDRSVSPYGKPCEQWADALVELSIRPDGRPEPALADHLAGCGDCGAYLRWLAPAMDVLAESVPGQTPPAELKRRVMAEVRADAARRQPERSALPRWSLLRPRVVLGAMAVAAVFAVAIFGFGSESGSFVPDSDERVYSLSMSTGGAAGELVATGDHGALHLKGMKQPPEGHVYQAWLRHGQQLVPSSVFAVSRSGEAEAAIPANVEGANELLVTIEPEGGSAEPSTRPRLAVSLD
jgi:anti-sigma-K factor RskA